MGDLIDCIIAIKGGLSAVQAAIDKAGESHYQFDSGRVRGGREKA
jgi:hypothetical protein